MKASIVRAGMLVPALLALFAADGAGQAPPADKGVSTPSQTQRDLPVGSLDIIDKQKPEIEIYTSPEDFNPSSPSGLKGIVVIPDEAEKSPAPPPDKESAAPPKKKDR